MGNMKFVKLKLPIAHKHPLAIPLANKIQKINLQIFNM